MVARDLAYHVIGLNTQCLWVTPTPIPGLHTIIVLNENLYLLKIGDNMTDNNNRFMRLPAVAHNLKTGLKCMPLFIALDI